MIGKKLLLLFLTAATMNVFAGTGNNASLLPVLTAPAGNFHGDNDTVVIRFGYKQSALYHAYTFEVIDSVVNILKKDTAVKLTIDGYSYIDEGNDTVRKYLSLNRALFVKEYVLGRGIDLSRIISVKGLGTAKSLYKNTDKEGKLVSCRAELLLIYPPPPPPVVISDRDLDGIADADDKCPDEYGYPENMGCADKDIIIVPFENRQSSLFASTYKVLDSVIRILRENPSYTFTIRGHAYKDEGINSVCENLAVERSEITKGYLISRYISPSRIDAIKNYGNRRPLNAGRNPMERSCNARVEILLNKHQNL